MKIFLRKMHRWLGLLMALQILAWMVSGLWFSLFPIEEIRGEHLARAPEQLGSLPTTESQEALAPPALVQTTLAEHLGTAWSLTSVELRRQEGAYFWRVAGIQGDRPFTRLLTGDGTRVLPRLDSEAAGVRAVSHLLRPGAVQSVEWIEQGRPDAEFRGRNLPLWKVRFDDPESLSLYLDPWTGEVVARRTTRWRVFDFLWMLHILDFESRDDFNHPLLQVAAFLGLVIALSGVILWAVTSRIFRGSRGSTGS